MTTRARDRLICECGHEGYLKCAENDKGNYSLEGSTEAISPSQAMQIGQKTFLRRRWRSRTSSAIRWKRHTGRAISSRSAAA